MNTDEDLCTTVSFFKALKRQTVASIPDAADGVNYPAALSVTALTPAIEYLHAFPWKKTSFNCEYHSSNHRFSSIVLNMKNPQVKNFAFKSSLGENLKSAQIKDKNKKKWFTFSSRHSYLHKGDKIRYNIWDKKVENLLFSPPLVSHTDQTQ